MKGQKEVKPSDDQMLYTIIFRYKIPQKDLK